MDVDLIDDTTARRIAAEWHGGQRSRMLSFATTGYIHADLESEIAAEISQLPSLTEALGDLLDDELGDAGQDLANLLAYVLYHGERGVQPGWSELHY